MYLQTHHARRSHGIGLALALALLFAALALAWPCRSAALEVGALLPGPLRDARIGSVGLALDGRLELRDVRWDGTLRGLRVEAAAPLVRVALGGQGVTVPALELTVDVAPTGAPAGAAPAGTAAVPPEPAAASAPPPPAAPPAPPRAAADRRGPLERAVAAAERAARLLGPVAVHRAAVTVQRGGAPIGRLAPLALRLEPQPDGSLRGVVAGRLAPEGPAGAEPADAAAGAAGAVDVEFVRAADGSARLRAVLQDVDLSPPLAGVAAALAPPAVLLREGRATLELDVALPAEGALTARGRALVADLVLDHPAIAPEPVAFRRLGAEFSATIERGERRVQLETTSGRLNEAAIDLSLALARRPGGAWHVEARVGLPEQPCDALMDAVPDALLGALAGARWRGRAGFALGLVLDTDEPRRLRLLLDGDPDRCEPQTLGRDVERALERLTTPFRASVGDPSGATPADLEVGPGTPGFVPYDEIPRHVRVGALATEDRAFFHHKGVSLRLIQGALRLDLAKGEYFYGGSTITQQLVKNLLLTRDKSLARKFQELLLAREVERRLTKERILELYLNCIEYGPGVFGLGPAALFYFGKDARRLDALEGAFLMALKPSPRTGFLVFRRGELNSRWRSKLRIVLERMVELGGLDAAAVEANAPYQPEFVPFDPAIHRPYPRR